MIPNTAGNLLHQLQPRTHYSTRSLVQERLGPPLAAVLPKPLEFFAKQVRTHRPKVVFQCLGQLQCLLVRKILRALQQAPPRLLQDRFVAVTNQSLRLFRADLVHRIAELLHHVEPIQHMDCLAQPLFDHVQVGLPHVAAHVLYFLTDRLAETFQTRP